MAYYTQTGSPELKHPVPTHPAYIPEPPSTPGSPQGYQRFVSSPPLQPQQQAVPPQPMPQAQPGFTVGNNNPYGMPHPAFQAGGQMAPPPGQMGGNPQMPIPQPDFGAWGMNDMTAQFGVQLGQSAVTAGQQYMQRNFGTFIPGVGVLKHHFNVSNSYVIQKLKVVAFPWRHRPWTRKMHRSEQGASEWQAPRDDINSPDLYIPAMALVTYILLAALQTGLQERFHPEIFGLAASKAFAVLIIDYIFVKLGCYFLNIQGTSQSFDLVAYSGYKFIGVIMTVVAGLLGFGRMVYSVVFFYAFAANAFFLLRSLRSVLLPDVSSTPGHVGTVNHAQRSRRITFLFLIAVSQLPYMGVLVRV